MAVLFSYFYKYISSLISIATISSVTRKFKFISFPTVLSPPSPPPPSSHHYSISSLLLLSSILQKKRNHAQINSTMSETHAISLPAILILRKGGGETRGVEKGKVSQLSDFVRTLPLST